VVTRAFFAQRDFSQTGILKEFYDSLEAGLADKGDEMFMSMGTCLPLWMILYRPNIRG
jgi:hypothetical protein